MRALKPPTEEDIQRVVVQAARLYGYEVLVTSRRRQRAKCPRCFSVLDYCRRCGRDMYETVRGKRYLKWPVQHDGCDEGIPDLYIRNRKKWPPRLWLGVEVKGPRTPFSNSRQKEFAEDGSIVIVRSWEDLEPILKQADMLFEREE